MSASQAAASGELLDLVSSSSGTSSQHGHNQSGHHHSASQGTLAATIYPNADAILQTLHTRFRQDVPYTAIGSTHLVVVNPYKVLGGPTGLGEEAVRAYADRVRDTSGTSAKAQPHIFDMAGKMYLLMRRKREAQGVVVRGPTSSGKSTSIALLTSQLLHLSAHTKRETNLAHQVKAALAVLDAFGNAKSVMNPNASMHSRFIQLNFSSGAASTPTSSLAASLGLASKKVTPEGRLVGARVLTWGLDKHRVVRLGTEERTFHIFYQFLMGATPEERDVFNLEDPSEYALLRGSGVYRLPSGVSTGTGFGGGYSDRGDKGAFAGGVSGDDAIGMGETRAALAMLGFKPKHLQSIFSILSSVLLLSNLHFGFSRDLGDSTAYPLSTPSEYQYSTTGTSSVEYVREIARLLGVKEEELTAVLVKRVRWVKKEVVEQPLDREGAEAQRDRIIQDLYAILFAFVGETANHRLASASAALTAASSDAPKEGLAAEVDAASSSIPLYMLDQPGFQSRNTAAFATHSTYGAPLVNSIGANTFSEFIANYQDELVNTFINLHTFSDDHGLNAVMRSEGMVLPELDGQGVDERAVEVLRGQNIMAPSIVSASGKKLPPSVLGALTRASYAAKTGKPTAAAMAQRGSIGLSGRSSGGGEEMRDAEFVGELQGLLGDRYRGVFSVEDSSVGIGGSPTSAKSTAFTITHYAASTTYTTALSSPTAGADSASAITTNSFVARDSDTLDPAFHALLRTSTDPFIAKLFGGPAVASERHARDPAIVVQAQVISRAIRPIGPGPLPSAIYSSPRKLSDVLGYTGSGEGTDFMADQSKAEARAEVEAWLSQGRAKMDLGKTYSVLGQVDCTLSEVVRCLNGVVSPPQLPALERLMASSALGEVSPFDDDAGEGSSSANSGQVAPIKSVGTRLFVVSHIRPNDSQSPNSFDKRRIRVQIGVLQLGGVVKRAFCGPSTSGTGDRASVELCIPIEKQAFCARYVSRMRGSVAERVRQCERAEGWVFGRDWWWRDEGEWEEGDLALGGGGRSKTHIWLTYDAWRGIEDRVRAAEKDAARGLGGGVAGSAVDYEDDGMTDYTHTTHNEFGSGNMLTIPSYSYGGLGPAGESMDNLPAARGQSGYMDGPGFGTFGKGGAGYVGVAGGNGSGGGNSGGGGTYGAGGLKSPNGQLEYPRSPSVLDSKDEVDGLSDAGRGAADGAGGAGGGGGGAAGGMVVKDAPNAVEEVPSSRTRVWWLRIVWMCTWLIPSFLLSSIGRMKRPDVRLAWREKVTIFWLIFLLNGTVIFYIVVFGRLLCPNYDKAWSIDEVGTHQGENDYFVTIQGVVYDVTDYVQGDHSDIIGTKSNSPDNLETLAGQDLTYYFPPPLVLACPYLVEDSQLMLSRKNDSVMSVSAARHFSGTRNLGNSEALKDDLWYVNRFHKTMKEYKKGPLVWDRKRVLEWAKDENMQKVWGFYKTELYDLTDYLHTLGENQNGGPYKFLNDDVVSAFSRQPGQDVTEALDKVLERLPAGEVTVNMACLKNAFYAGEVDFRKTAKCQTSNYLLIVMSVILMSSMGLKFLAALQLGSKRSPELQDKFVLCQVPCYTEGEDSLRRTIDSLAALNYDDKRKLIFIICDGNIIGSGNDRTTPRIALDILGVDPAVDPEPLLFKSVGEGSKALNYAKIYSGLYEFEGHVVPYMVVVKVGKPTERSRPGNRGKRDSQILLMQYLNRVHFDMPMNPMELEIYHQMRNVIGIDPAFYEYIFTIDADTTVTPESLNRLVASSADDSSIIGICGETKLTNEEGSWWTMIQVYEYYISHHLSKAFESLFGSVTCLPGCFSLYRIRTADKGRPIIISNRIIEEYAEPNVDTLHKKNLFSLGEDRFLTTLMMKHFPSFKTKFCPDAIAHTMAPESWRVLFSQRRRWINSTVHNLCELVMLQELFGFCCFSMRFFVFIDLLSTLILPATVVYLVYLIVVVATQAAAFPTIAIIMLSIVYGLQAIIFMIKREFMLIGWMVVYILSYPVYSFFLPVYSFWCMDEFSWGNTRVVVGEGKEKKVLMNEEEKFDESMIPLKKFSEYEAETWETGSRRSDDTGYNSQNRSRQQHGSNIPPGSRAGSVRDGPGSAFQHGSDYYRDTNPLGNNSANPNLRMPNAHAMGGGSQHSHASNGGYSLSHFQGAQPMSTFGGPQMPPFMPFASGNGGGSVHGSDYGGQAAAMNMGPMGGPMMPMAGMMGYQNTGSVYGMPAMMTGGTAQRNTMFGMGMGGPMYGSQEGGPLGGPPQMMAAQQQQQQRPMSTFSMATSVNPFAGPSMNANPTDDELFNALRTYLSTQDLMSVTKKTAREAIMAKFPKADLTSKKDFLNQSIDRILSES